MGTEPTRESSSGDWGPTVGGAPEASGGVRGATPGRVTPPEDPEVAKRFQAILSLVQGRATAAEVADRLGVSEPRVWQLRSAFLAGAEAALAPAPPGRPPKAPPTPEEIELARTRRENAELRLRLECSSVREAIAIAMPELLARPGKDDKRSGRRKEKGA